MKQWLAQWDDMQYDGGQNQSRPKPHFYMFSVAASQLRRLSGIYRRDTDELRPRAEDLSIQRKHDPERSEEIRRYVEGGYPWSGLSAAKRDDPANDRLRKPGWLPTAVVVNILEPGDMRSGRVIATGETISIEEGPAPGMATLSLPVRSSSQDEESVPPIEVIDGQHRLFAFQEGDGDVEDYELPVVAFHGLDISWQAYLFWTINIKPKKINASLAFDLYPLLREQEWLNSGEVVQVYRESRAQELTEMLWSSPDSPWYRRINMLGGSRAENGPVTQAAFIRSLIASMVKSWRPRGSTGGLFGGTPDATSGGLSWSRLQQGAFLVTAWKLLADAIADSNAGWAMSLRQADNTLGLDGERLVGATDPAFAGSFTLLATDQGIRGFQSVINDLCYVRNRELSLAGWRDLSAAPEVTPEYISIAAATLADEPVHRFLAQISERLAVFDWRSSGFPGLSEQERLRASALRGSSGYKEMRIRLIDHLRGSENAEVQSAANLVDRA
ncbi:DGQHR domain-containing protein [Microbacterium sp. SL75]|uniref:DGQHR domain-containing protein n=1 Tax=Microbacterium sp. SL75 TaxID=2995140 RepID=UPI00226EEEB6|nr:DGQHR domain-containing protein [Microbacterium sp. SL75]WAC70168.1 DGQHR domain-containing protein [Microbacterium sp. SL75]